jgi:hypothetical protein
VSASTATAEEEGNNKHHQEHDKENLGDTRGGARDTTEAQYGSDNGNDQECDCPAQHDDSPYASIRGAAIPDAWSRHQVCCLEHPTLLTGHVEPRLGLVDVHHAQGGRISRLAADGAEMGLGEVLSRRNRSIGLLAVLPEHELLAADQGDHQRKDGEQPLLDIQWRKTQLGGTLAIHPETPPTLVVIIGLGRTCLNALGYSVHCSLHAIFPVRNKLNKIKHLSLIKNPS